MLKGKYVGLRAIEKDDLPCLLEWRNNPEYRKYFREYRELGMGQQYSWYENILLKDQRTIMFSIIDLKNRRLLGACGLCYINWIDRNADLSIYIGADNLYIDNKYATDTASTIIKYAFDELGLHRLWAEVYDSDERKIKLFEALGFKLDGCHRETHWTEGKWCNSLFYGLLQKEFPNKRNR
jgi:RimJ/RimL family protein N-acetyltransferase